MLVGGETPEVLIDRSLLKANIDGMAAATDAAGIGLRPHVKTHKVVEIARMQLAAGAVGLTVATVGEAEVFVSGGASDVFIAYPLWVTPTMAHRLASLAERAHITVGVDSVEGAANLITCLGGSARSVEVWVEIDSGHHRSGVLPGSRELEQLAAHPGLPITGVFTFPGHAYAPGQPLTAAAQEGDALWEAAAVLRQAGHDIRHASGGSSPSAAFSSPEHVTEVRPGVYAFGDAQQYELGRCAWDSIALTVAATVVSRRTRPTRQVIVNAGSKVLGSDRPNWVSGYGRVVGALDARISALSEHHGTVDWPEGRPMPTLGEQIRLVPNHVCITMNLVDEVAVVQDGHLVDRWRVAARGRNS